MYRILIVDDEKEIRTLLRLYLEKDNNSVIEAADGVNALELFDEYKFDLALIDIMIPGINGFELLIVKSIVDKHGFRIHVEEMPAPYTKAFILTIPKP